MNVLKGFSKDSFEKLGSMIKLKIEEDNNLFNSFLESAVIFGNRIWSTFLLTEFSNLVNKLGKETTEKLLEDAIYSDDAIVFETLVKNEHFCPSEKIKNIARSCGKRKVIEVLEPVNQDKQEENEEHCFNSFVKSEEFQYTDNIGKLINEFLIKEQTSRISVPIYEIVNKMKAQVVHYQNQYKYGCPSDCEKDRICLRIRQTIQLIKKLLKNNWRTNRLFQNPEVIVVGSLKEETKVGDIDEADIALIVNSVYDKNYFEFDEKNQQLKLTPFYSKKRKYVPDEIAQFIEEDGTFNCTKYFHLFLTQMNDAIQKCSNDLPEGLTISVKFTPCEICKSIEDVTPQYVRCRHEPDCEEHKKRKTDSNYEEKCECGVYNSPSMTISKIGVVLHLGMPCQMHFEISVCQSVG